MTREQLQEEVEHALTVHRYCDAESFRASVPALDAVIATVAREVLTAVADEVEASFCCCLDDYKARGRVDPQCGAHDHADYLRGCAAEYAPKEGA